MGQSNLKSITTDRGINMCVKNKRVLTFVSKAVENDSGSRPLVLHCKVHQQSLYVKYLDISAVLKPVISVVSFRDPIGWITNNSTSLLNMGEHDLPYPIAVH